MYRRIDAAGNEVITLLNFSPYLIENYKVGLPHSGRYRLLLSSDSEEFGGKDRHIRLVTAQSEPMHGLEYSADFTLPPFGALLYKCTVKKVKSQAL